MRFTRFIKLSTHTLSSALVIFTAAAVLSGCPQNNDGKTDGTADKTDKNAAQGDKAGTNPTANSPHAPAESWSAKLKESDVVAVVGTRTFTYGDFQRFVAQQLGMRGMSIDKIPPTALENVEKQAYDRMLERELIHQEAARRGLAATDADVEKAKSEFSASLPEGKTLADVLAMQKMDEAVFLQEVRVDLAIGKLFDEINKSITIPDDELRKKYEANKDAYNIEESARVYHVFFDAKKQGGEDKAAAKAEEIRKQLADKGKKLTLEEFQKVAVANSDDPAVNVNKGDLGKINHGSILPPLEEAAFKLKKNELSGVVKSARGSHVLLGQGVTPAKKRTFEEAKTDILNVERVSKQLDEVQRLVNDLKNKANIERKHEPIARAAPAGGGGGMGLGPHGAPRSPTAPVPGKIPASGAPSRSNVIPGSADPHGAGIIPLAPGANDAAEAINKAVGDPSAHSGMPKDGIHGAKPKNP